MFWIKELIAYVLVWRQILIREPARIDSAKSHGDKKMDNCNSCPAPGRNNQKQSDRYRTLVLTLYLGTGDGDQHLVCNHLQIKHLISF